jgi:hypothetical protein
MPGGTCGCLGGGILDIPFERSMSKINPSGVSSAYMNDKTQQSPTVPVYNKALRKWTYYIFPEGVEQEAGDFADEETARAASWKTYRAWQANGCKY